MKQILFIDLTPFYGGGQKFILNFNNNIEPDLYHYLVACPKLFEKLNSRNKILINTSETNSGEIIKIVNTYIRESKINVVILNGNRPIYFSPFIKANLKIAYKHTSNNAFSGLKKYLAPLLLNICYIFCHRVVLLYTAARSEVWFQKYKIRIINNGIEVPYITEIKRAESDMVEFVTISRLEIEKGLEWLINVFKDINMTGKKIQLTLIGSGPDMVYLQMISKDSKNPIQFLGFVDGVDQVLHNSDVLILPSKFECFPLSILEAMSFSLPVIATNTGGVSEMIESGVNGYVLNYSDSEGLRNSIIQLAENKELRNLMGNKSYEIFDKKFKINHAIQNIEKIINEKRESKL